VVIDDRAGGRMATEALLDLGHRRIAFVGDRSGGGFGFIAGAHRREGYRQALETAGMEVIPAYVREGPHDQTVARRLTEELLRLSRPPTAVFAASDRQALGVLEAARAARLDVPGDLSVIGFDDVELAAYAQLSTVRQPLRASGVRGAELLLEATRSGDNEINSVELDLELVMRGSTAPI
jgi:DNA-binding LacI/PurR family transcriptional regulator